MENSLQRGGMTSHIKKTTLAAIWIRMLREKGSREKGGYRIDTGNAVSPGERWWLELGVA